MKKRILTKIVGSNPLFRLCGDRPRARARRAAPSVAERRFLENFGLTGTHMEAFP